MVVYGVGVCRLIVVVEALEGSEADCRWWMKVGGGIEFESRFLYTERWCLGLLALGPTLLQLNSFASVK